MSRQLGACLRGLVAALGCGFQVGGVAGALLGHRVSFPLVSGSVRAVVPAPRTAFGPAAVPWLFSSSVMMLRSRA